MPSDRSAPAPVLAAVWCRSVGTTWTLELRTLDPDIALGTIVDWISSGVPVSQPAPDALADELLAARGLRLIRDSSAYPGTHSRHRIGRVCADADPSGTAVATRNQPTDGLRVPRQRKATETPTNMS